MEESSGTAGMDAQAFGAKLGFGRRPALLVIDFVCAYFDEAGPLYAGVEHTIEPARRVLRAARDVGAPVIFTRVEYAVGGANGGMFFRKVPALSSFVGDSGPGRIIAELAPLEAELVVTKQYASSFFGTSLDSTLRVLQTDTVVMMGLSTSGCVRSTAVDAIQLGFVPVVVSDAVGDRSQAPHDASLFDIEAKYGDVMTSAGVVQEFERLRGG